MLGSKVSEEGKNYIFAVDLDGMERLHYLRKIAVLLYEPMISVDQNFNSYLSLDLLIGRNSILNVKKEREREGKVLGPTLFHT